MNRKIVITFSIALVFISAMLPVIATLYLSWMRAKDIEREKLAGFAERTIERAQLSFDEAYLAMKSFDEMKALPCSEEHINLMRRATFNFRNVNEIGYFEDGLLKCTSWGKINEKIEKSIIDFTLPNNVQITYSIYPLISKSHPVIALHYKNHNALIDPAQFTDIITDPSIQIAIATIQDQVISTVNHPSSKIIKQVLSGNEQNKDHFIFVYKSSYFTVVVMEPRSFVLKKLCGELIVLLPLGIFMAIIFVTIIIWISRRRLSPLGELKIAIAKREFIVHYQPIIELKTNLCIGAEALVRWQRPDGTMIAPDLFIPLAEESGLIFSITDQVIQHVITDLRKLLISNRALHIAINIASSDLRTGRILQSLETLLPGTAIAPKQIWLEVTERGFINIDSTKETIEQARNVGYAMVIDDFGTGYSSLSYLHGLPLDSLKIDKSFIDSLGTDSATSSVTLHIISIAKTLQLTTIAEGIETQAQVDYLIEHGVEYGQGWFFAKAMPAKDFIRFYECRLQPDEGQTQKTG